MRGAMGGFLICWLAVAAAQTPQASKTGRHASGKQAAASSVNSQQDAGEVKFHQNCSRCHNAPQELSERISGTVVLHMRVRASLSDADAKAILRYLAP